MTLKEESTQITITLQNMVMSIIKEDGNLAAFLVLIAAKAMRRNMLRNGDINVSEHVSFLLYVEGPS
ncbi:hypothetical protein [Metabacillus niabensis]|uniref:hypothetical protein n=1 Tax=Metabacillus TaxID=2675233 RepID=UPI001481E2B8